MASRFSLDLNTSSSNDFRLKDPSHSEKASSSSFVSVGNAAYYKKLDAEVASVGCYALSTSHDELASVNLISSTAATAAAGTSTCCRAEHHQLDTDFEGDSFALADYKFIMLGKDEPETVVPLSKFLPQIDELAPFPNTTVALSKSFLSDENLKLEAVLEDFSKLFPPSIFSEIIGLESAVLEFRATLHKQLKQATKSPESAFTIESGKLLIDLLNILDKKIRELIYAAKGLQTELSGLSTTEVSPSKIAEYSSLLTKLKNMGKSLFKSINTLKLHHITILDSLIHVFKDATHAPPYYVSAATATFVYHLALGHRVPNSSKRLGHGSFGVVDQVTLNNRAYAKKTTHSDDPVTLKSIKVETAALAVFSGSSHVLTPVLFANDERGATITTELATATLSKFAKIGPKALNKMLKDLLHALAEHEKIGLFHNDVKPDNILFFKNGTSRNKSDRFVLADPGIATYGKAKTGTTLYAAPELLREDTSSNLNTDVWSLGATLFKVCTKKDIGILVLTKHCQDTGETLKAVNKHAIPSLFALVVKQDTVDKLLEANKEHFTLKLYEAIKLMLIIDPKLRPAAGELFKAV